MARRKYTPEFKREAVRLVREESMTYAQVGTDLGVDKSTIRDWCKLSEAGKLETSKSPGPASRSVEEENAALRREVRILREEREILKKAAAFFARETR
jgi:transposase